MSMAEQLSGSIPTGTQIIGFRETTQSNGMGSVESGIVVGFKLPSGNTSSLFVPDSLIGNTAAIGAAITERVNALQRIEGLNG